MSESDRLMKCVENQESGVFSLTPTDLRHLDIWCEIFEQMFGKMPESIPIKYFKDKNGVLVGVQYGKIQKPKFYSDEKWADLKRREAEDIEETVNYWANREIDPTDLSAHLKGVEERRKQTVT